MTLAFRLDKNLMYKISQPDNFLLLDCGIPGQTSHLVFETINTPRLQQLQIESFEVFDPVAQHAPAAVSMVPCFLNGTVGVRLPTPEYGHQRLRKIRTAN